MGFADLGVGFVEFGTFDGCSLDCMGNCGFCLMMLLWASCGVWCFRFWFCFVLVMLLFDLLFRVVDWFLILFMVVF